MNPQAAPLIDDACRHEVMRIAELQAEDFHLDRPLYFACREDREVQFAIPIARAYSRLQKLCKEVPAGNGKVFECLLSHQHDDRMDPHVSLDFVSRLGRVCFAVSTIGQ
jgi:Golgi apparatus protein 1